MNAKGCSVTVENCARPHWARGFCRLHYRRWKANGTPVLTTPAERFWRQVERRGTDECWLWTGTTLKGYGRGRLNGGYYYAHRLSYELCVGPVPDGMVVRHTCDNPPCCNPAHLELGTQRDNVQDMIDRGRGHWQGKPNVCARGHEFTPENTYVRPDGHRTCKACVAAGRRRRRAEARAENHTGEALDCGWLVRIEGAA